MHDMAGHVMRSPRILDLELTSSCNLRCRYCYFMGNDQVTYGELPTGEWLAFLEELGRESVLEVTLAGGEPLVRPDLRELIAGIVKNRMRFSILSNGTLVDDDLAAFLASTGRCSSVQVSLDGSCPETHDAARGAGSFARAYRGLQVLLRHRVPTTVRVTIHRQNVDDLENTARLLLEETGLAGFTTNSAGDLGSCRQNAEDMVLTTAERQRAMEVLHRLERKYPGRISALAGPQADLHIWRRMEEGRRASAPAFANGGRLTGCGCAFSKLAVRSDGTFVPCTMLPHIALGRINRDRLLDVWNEHPFLNRLRSRSDLPLSSFPFCAGCEYQPYCTGNCPGLAHALTGSVFHPSPDACLRQHLLQGGRIP